MSPSGGKTSRAVTVVDLLRCECGLCLCEGKADAFEVQGTEGPDLPVEKHLAVCEVTASAMYLGG